MKIVCRLLSLLALVPVIALAQPRGDARTMWGTSICADTPTDATVLSYNAARRCWAPKAGVTGPAGPAGPTGPAGPSGQDGAPGTPGYSPNQLLSGGGVAWTSGLSFTVASSVYLIGNVQHSSPQTNLTLSAADPANPRIDAIAVDSTGSVVVIQGTPAPAPARPTGEPSTQLELTWVTIGAGATVPTDVVLNDVYHENVEWTTSRSGTAITLASTNNPHAGTVDVEATNAATNNYVQFQAPAPLDLATRNTLVFYIRSKAAWASTRSLQLTFRSSGTQKGSIVTLREGQFGFASGTTGSYQLIIVPLSLFMANGLSVNQLRMTVAGSGTNLGFYIDDVTLQGGIVPPVAPTGMAWAKPWNASRAYAVNDVVTRNGTQYVATLANTNVQPPNSTYWDVSAAPAMVGDSGAGGSAGLVPAPAAGDAAAGKYLSAGGSWVAISTTASVYVMYKAAVCTNSNAALGFATLNSPTDAAPEPICVTGTNAVYGVARFLDGTTVNSVQDHFPLPASLTGNVDLDIYWQTAVIAGSAVWQLQTGCAANTESLDVTWNAVQTVTSAAGASATRRITATISPVTMTGCAQNEELMYRLSRDPTHASDDLGAAADLIGLRWTVRHN